MDKAVAKIAEMLLAQQPFLRSKNRYLAYTIVSIYLIRVALRRKFCDNFLTFLLHTIVFPGKLCYIAYVPFCQCEGSQRLGNLI